MRKRSNRWDLVLGASVVATLLTAGCLPPEDSNDDAVGGSTSAATASTTGMGFLVSSDTGGTTITFECSMFDQDCPANQKCSPWISDGGLAWNATRCVDVPANAVGIGETCTMVNGGASGMDNCQAGAMCWAVAADTDQGVCVELCSGTEVSPTCTDPSTTCSIANDGAIIVCLPNCDPINQDCLGPDDACYAIGDAFVCGFDASIEGMNGFGAPCEYLNACQQGMMCQDATLIPGCTTLGCCTPFCDVTEADAPCPGDGQACVPYFEEGSAPRPELADVGVCLLPS